MTGRRFRARPTRFTRRSLLRRGSAVLAWTLLPGTGAALATPPAGSGSGRLAAPVAMYGVVPFLFGPHGWRSVEVKLPHLEDLGVDTLWLSPVLPTATGGFGYDPISYAHPRRDYGTETEFRQMIAAIQSRGMRVILDFPTNDTSDRHPYFLDAQRQGRKSPYYHYYQRDRQGTPVHYFDWTNLPNLNFENPAVRSWISSVYCHWLREYGVDGFRMDAAWGVRRRSPSYWPGAAVPRRQRHGPPVPDPPRTGADPGCGDVPIRPRGIADALHRGRGRAQYQPYETQGPISWNCHDGLYSHYRRLIALRRAHPALREGTRSEVSGAKGDGILAFRRVRGRQSITAIFNFGRQHSYLDLDRLDFDAQPVDLLSGQTVTLSDQGRIELSGTSALLLADAGSVVNCRGVPWAD